jgi:predicted phosphodiesterase
MLSDVHGNPLALQSCLRQLSRMKLDQLLFLGDAVGYFPDGAEVLDSLQNAGFTCQQGNHERMMLTGQVTGAREHVYRLQAARDQLGPERLSGVAGWPESRELDVDGKRVLLLHGSPSDILFGYVYPDTDLAQFDGLDCDAVFMANTHRPFIRWRDSRLWVNIGSVGLPRDCGNLAAFAVYDSEENSCRVFRIPFDTAAVLKRYRDQIDDSVVQCLQRQSPHVVGELLTP